MHNFIGRSRRQRQPLRSPAAGGSSTAAALSPPPAAAPAAHVPMMTSSIFCCFIAARSPAASACSITRSQRPSRPAVPLARGRQLNPDPARDLRTRGARLLQPLLTAARPLLRRRQRREIPRYPRVEQRSLCAPALSRSRPWWSLAAGPGRGGGGNGRSSAPLPR